MTCVDLEDGTLRPSADGWPSEHYQVSPQNKNDTGSFDRPNPTASTSLANPQEEQGQALIVSHKPSASGSTWDESSHSLAGS